MSLPKIFHLAASPVDHLRHNTEACNWWCRNLSCTHGTVSLSVTSEEMLKGSKLFHASAVLQENKRKVSVTLREIDFSGLHRVSSFFYFSLFL